MADVSAWGLALSPVLSGAVGAGAAIITTKLSSNAEDKRWQRERDLSREENARAEARQENLELARMRSEDRQAVVQFLSLARQIGLAAYTASLGGRVAEPSAEERPALSQAFERVQLSADGDVARPVEAVWDALHRLFEASRTGQHADTMYEVLQQRLREARTAFRENDVPRTG